MIEYKNDNIVLNENLKNQIYYNQNSLRNNVYYSQKNNNLICNNVNL